jgi:hypothetical protein
MDKRFRREAGLARTKVPARVESGLLRSLRRRVLTLQSGRVTAGSAHGLLTPEQQSSLAERVRTREPSAEEELVSLFSDRIRVLVLARTRDPETARDLAQEVMLAVVAPYGMNKCVSRNALPGSSTGPPAM